MRKLLILLIALSANVVEVVSPVSAQGFNGGGFNVGLGPFAAGGGCTAATNFLARTGGSAPNYGLIPNLSNCDSLTIPKSILL
jgi:hypothetical protein